MAAFYSGTKRSGPGHTAGIGDAGVGWPMIKIDINVRLFKNLTRLDLLGLDAIYPQCNVPSFLSCS